jgi:hypothetical protein
MPFADQLTVQAVGPDQLFRIGAVEGAQLQCRRV